MLEQVSIRLAYMNKKKFISQLFRFVCGICHLKIGLLLKLKGICDEDVFNKEYFDREFYIYGHFNGKPHFRYIVCLSVTFYISFTT